MSRQSGPGTAEARSFRGVPWTSSLVGPATSLVTWFEQSAVRYSGTPCLVEVDAFGAEAGRISYRGLADAVTERAAWLVSELGPGTAHVGVTVTNTIESVIDLLAVLRCGAAAVIVDAADPPERREEQLTALCGAVIESADGDRRVRRTGHPPAVTPDPAHPVHPTAFVLYTTGSTAASKPVAQSHYAVLVNVTATMRHHRMGPGEVMGCALPISHVNGLHFGVLATLLSGGTCVLFREFDPLTYLRVLDAAKAVRATTVPSLLQVLAESRRWPALRDLRYFVSAAAPLSAETAAAVYARGGRRIVQGYGLSECMNFATTMPVDLSVAEYEERFLRCDVPPVGHQLHGCEVSVAATDGEPSAAGEVVVRGHSLMTGYIGDADATSRALGGGLRTGDLGRLADGTGGQWLTLLGRGKNVAKCGGISVSLEEVDRLVGSLHGVRETCSVRRADARRGDAITVFYAASPGAVVPTSQVSAHVRRRFDASRIGLRVVETERIPRLRSGKVDRRSLEDRSQEPA